MKNANRIPANNSSRSIRFSAPGRIAAISNAASVNRIARNTNTDE